MDDVRDRRSSRDRDISWSEIDKKRNRSRHTGDDRPEPRSKKQAVTGTSRYKGELSALFSRGSAGSRLQAVAGQAGLKVGGEQPERQKALRAILDALGPDAIRKAIDAFEAEFGELPDDPEILTQALEHPDESRASATMRRLRDHLAGHVPTRRTLMLQRVKAVEARIESAELGALAEEIRRMLGG